MRDVITDTPQDRLQEPVESFLLESGELDYSDGLLDLATAEADPAAALLRQWRQETSGTSVSTAAVNSNGASVAPTVGIPNKPVGTPAWTVTSTNGRGRHAAPDDDDQARSLPARSSQRVSQSPPVAAASAVVEDHRDTTRQASSESVQATKQSAPPAIEVRHLHKKFSDMVAVADVSFDVPAGSIVALLGPNGAGKTTTVNMLCTLLRPDGGSASVAGHDVASQPAAVRRSIMLTGQFAALDESLSGRENLVLFGRLLGLSKPAAKARADELLEMFSLTAAAKKRVGQYSGGMRRRIDIACGLLTSPKVVFLDEPTTGLDPRSRSDVWELVEQLRDSGVSVLLTTQYLEEADMLADRIVVIDKGTVIAQGTADELKAATGAAYCEVTPARPADAPRLREVLSDLIDAEDDGESPVVAIPAPDGPEILVEVIGRVKDAGITLSDITMRRPSLDEVFLALTDPTRDEDRREVSEEPGRQ